MGKILTELEDGRLCAKFIPVKELIEGQQYYVTFVGSRWNGKQSRVYTFRNNYKYLNAIIGVSKDVDLAFEYDNIYTSNSVIYGRGQTYEIICQRWSEEYTAEPYIKPFTPIICKDRLAQSQQEIATLKNQVKCLTETIKIMSRN